MQLGLATATVSLWQATQQGVPDVERNTRVSTCLNRKRLTQNQFEEMPSLFRHSAMILYILLDAEFQLAVSFVAF